MIYWVKSNLFDSKGKQRLLSALCEQPGRFFSVKELSLRTGLPLARVKEVLAVFSKHEIVNIENKKREKYYQINARSQAYSELSALFTPTKGKGKDLVERIISSAGEVELAVLSGVFTGRPKAQADLLLVGKFGPKRLNRAIAELQALAANEINFAEFSPNEFLDRYYSYDWFVKEVMDNEPIIIVDKLLQKEKKVKHGRKYLLATLLQGKNK